MNLAIANIRRAARVLERNGQVVNLKNLSRILRVPTLVVEEYVVGIDDLRQEIHLTGGMNKRFEFYRAAKMLHSAGVAVTCRRIAVLSCARENNVATWFGKHRELAAYFGVIHGLRHRAACAARRREWVELLRKSAPMAA